MKGALIKSKRQTAGRKLPEGEKMSKSGTTWKRIRRSFKKKSPIHKSTLKSKIVINTVYGNEELRKQNKRFNKVNFLLKNKLIVPVLLLFKRWYNKNYEQEKERVNLPQFEHVKLFEKIFNEATTHWQHKYIQSLHPEQDRKKIDEIRAQVEKGEGNGSWMLMIKDMAKTLFMADDAYLEWLPMFLYETYFQMRKVLYDKSFEHKTYHLMHTVPSVMDPDFEVVYLRMKALKNIQATMVASQGGFEQSLKKKK